MRRADYKSHEVFNFITLKLTNKVTCMPKIAESENAIENYLDSSDKLKNKIYRDGTILTIDMSELLTNSTLLIRQNNAVSSCADTGQHFSEIKLVSIKDSLGNQVNL